MSGQLVKFKLKSFKDNKFSQPGGDFDFPLNPRNFSQDFGIALSRAQAPGNQGSDPSYRMTRPEEVSIDFVLDGTGAVPLPASLAKKSVSQQVEKFKEVAYKLEGKIHRPRYLKLIWGDTVFDCILSGMEVKYTLFSADGKPLRAEIKARFLQYIEAKKRLAIENKNSPDLTHMRTVGGADNLLNMTFGIYEDPAFYLEIARVNGLVNFRRLREGDQLIFPPVDKSTP